MQKYKVGDRLRRKPNDQTQWAGRELIVVNIDTTTHDGTSYWCELTKNKRMYLEHDCRWYTESCLDEYELIDSSSDEDIEDTERYKTGSGKQLFDILKDDLLSEEEYKGFLKGNVYKYLKRYEQKNGVKDLAKAQVYIAQLQEFEGGIVNEN